MPDPSPELEAPQLVQRALEILGKRRLILAIHDGSFPSDPDEEIGRGTPYGSGGRAFVAFLHRLGFNGLQLGPQGQTSRYNPSPYDCTAFSRNTLSIAAGALVKGAEWGGLLSEAELASAVETAGCGCAPDRVRYPEAFDIQSGLLRAAFQRFEVLRLGQGEQKPWEARLRGFRRRNRDWLEPDSLYEPLVQEHGGQQWPHWQPDGAEGLDRRLFCPLPQQSQDAGTRRRSLNRRYAHQRRYHAFCQLLAQMQHEAFHQAARRLGLALYADLHIGLSAQDTWGLQHLLLKGYRMGAPPSRTNPDGQPWNYPVFDPERYQSTAAGLAPRHVLAARSSVASYLRRRLDRLFGDYEGLRIDHPQGLVCPWVYREEDPDPLHAVQNGARLFASPEAAQHPRLASLAIATVQQLNPDPRVPRHDDGWVRELEQDQVRRYAALMSVVMQAADNRAADRRDIACEILSTLPYPLARVIALFDLGRFRVTQKADPSDPADVYRSENAAPRDWIMLGTHDTPPVWRLVRSWAQSDRLREWAGYLARRLGPTGSTLHSRLAQQPGLLVHALLADALLSRAEQLVVFFADLFGLEEVYNRPGSVDPENWTLRVPRDYRRSYPLRAQRLQALNLPFALALALKGLGGGSTRAYDGLIAGLERAAGRPQTGARPA